jgi:hypothetical protein
MNRVLVRLALPCLLIATQVQADDGPIFKQLEALGGKVTIKDGVVTQVSFTDCSQLGEAEFRAIGQLTHLKNLTLYGKCQGLTDATVIHLTGLKELETLGTDGAQLTDDGLKHLSALANLRSASFFHTSFRMKGFTGVGFGHLQACSKLEKLTVAGVSMGDEGVAAIASITQLRDFSTWHTYQTETGNALIAKLPNLRALKIGQRLARAGAKAPSLSDASLPVLARMTTLETLKLGEAHFTAEALRTLKSLPNLKQLTLYETDLSATDADKIRKELPGATIDWQPLTHEQRKKFELYLKP